MGTIRKPSARCQEQELAFESHDEYVEFTAPHLETFLMLALDYQA